VLDDELRSTTTGFLLRALRWFRGQGFGIKRVMTDNGCAYRSRRFGTPPWLHAIRNILTRPYTP
jgi:transposase InsO family protein